MQITISKVILFVIFAGITLHLYTALINAKPADMSGLIFLFIFSSLPYLICLLLFIEKRALTIIWFCGVSAVFLIDCMIHSFVFISMTHSTGAIVLLFMPIWNLFFFMPMGMAGGYVIKSRKNL